MVHILIKMVLLTKEIGKMIFSMVMEQRNGQRIHFTKVILDQDKKKVKVCINGQMDQHILDNGKRIKYMASVNIIGQMVDSMKGNGKIIICMAKVYIFGKTAENIKDLI